MDSRLVIDWAAEMAAVQALPAGSRLPQLILRAGAQVWREDPRMVSKSAARLWCVGGLPVAALMAAGLSLEALAAMARASMGAAGAMSYLALPGGSPESAYAKIAVELGHGSCAHAASVSLVVAGVSCAAANEFNSQRDLVHLARVTEARTLAQSDPMMVAPDQAMLPMARAVLEAAQEQASRAKGASRLGKASAMEGAHLMYPAAKATAMVVTGTLRNFQKLLAAQDDPGKEDEYRSALGAMREVLAGMWPELFERPEPVRMEQRWAKPEAFEPLLSGLDFKGLDVVELGAGRGSLTRALLALGAASIDAWELDPSIGPLADPRVSWRVADIQDAKAAHVAGKAIACFPPYSALPWILPLCEGVEHAILMVPPKALAPLLGSGWRLLGALRGSDFEPASEGTHFVAAKGLRARG